MEQEEIKPNNIPPKTTHKEITFSRRDLELNVALLCIMIAYFLLIDAVVL
jgi:hypothetical protein